MLIFGIGKEYWELLVCFVVLPACVTGWEYLYIMLFRSNLILNACEMDKLSKKDLQRNTWIDIRGIIQVCVKKMGELILLLLVLALSCV